MPGTVNTICDLSIREMARLYRRRALSPVEVLDSCFARIHKLNPTLNAFVTLSEELARKTARNAEQQLRDSDNLPMLFGIPFSVKDTLATAGVRTTFGSRLFADFVPEEDAAAVTAVKNAGGIMVGKTNSPTLGWIGLTHNKLFGPTPNPWNKSRAAGGSSGGAAVSAVARLTPVNIGTDGGGSLRIPASFSGTVGFKPSYGRVANYPTGPNWGLQHIGPIANTIDDIAVAFDALSAADERDPYSLPPSTTPFADTLNEPVAPLRILYSTDLGYAESVDPEVAGICRRAAMSLSELGHQVTEGNPRWSSPLDAWRILFVAGIAARLGPFAVDRAADIEDKLLEFIEEGRQMGPDTYYRAWLAKNDWWQQVLPTFQQYDLVVTPTVACPPIELGRDTAGSINGKPLSFYGWAPFSAPFNMTGQPAISVPAGFTSDGLPVGVQFVGRRFADSLVLRVARAYEAIRPWSGQIAPSVAT